MSDVVENAERAALRGIAHLLPERFKQIIELVAEPVLPTPYETVPAPTDSAAARLGAIDHIVVLMQENRSFDHMLGYLSLAAAQGGRERTGVDGLRGPEVNHNPYHGSTYAIHHLPRTHFDGEAEDPDHSGPSVDQQLADGGTGFVANFARISTQRAAKLNVPVPPIYALPSFVRHLDQHQVDWRWYSFDPGTLRACDPAYRLTGHEHFAYVDQRKLSTREHAVGELDEEGSFLDDVANGRLPAVSWIDPRFKHLRVLGPDSNDDHPPSDIVAGQDLVLTVYHALSASPAWARMLLVIVYDEHGGFYDHVAPPAAVDDHPDFQHLGVRVPALLISPLVAAGSTSTQMLGPDFQFDHTSIIKTILTRFCNADGQIPAMTRRVQAANHLGHLLADGPPRAAVADHTALADQLTQWRLAWAQARFTDPVAAANPPHRLTDFQGGYYEMARILRQAGLPGGHP